MVSSWTPSDLEELVEPDSVLIPFPTCAARDTTAITLDAADSPSMLRKQTSYVENHELISKTFVEAGRPAD